MMNLTKIKLRILLYVFLICSLEATHDSSLDLSNSSNFEIVSNEAIAEWNDRAEEWAAYIGTEGEKDANRTYQSDPVLWAMLKDIDGLTILDAGCGEGYLSRKLSQRGAHVIGVDASDKLIDIAKQRALQESLIIDYRIEDCIMMKSIPPESIDRIVSNYVLMDIPQLDETIQEFHRVLKLGGEVVAVFLHPCFPMEIIIKIPGLVISYGWKLPYFQEHVMRLPVWSNFNKGFTMFHRPLSTYWKTFQKMGFEIIDFQEPYLSDEAKKQLDQELVEKFTAMPHSVAFLLRKNVVAYHG